MLFTLESVMRIKRDNTHKTPGTCMCSVIEDIIFAFDAHSLSTYYVSGPVLGARDTKRKVFDKGGR